MNHIPAKIVIPLKEKKSPEKKAGRNNNNNNKKRSKLKPNITQ